MREGLQDLSRHHEVAFPTLIKLSEDHAATAVLVTYCSEDRLFIDSAVTPL